MICCGLEASSWPRRSTTSVCSVKLTFIDGLRSWHGALYGLWCDGRIRWLPSLAHVSRPRFGPVPAADVWRHCVPRVRVRGTTLRELSTKRTAIVQRRHHHRILGPCARADHHGRRPCVHLLHHSLLRLGPLWDADRADPHAPQHWLSGAWRDLDEHFRHHSHDGGGP